MATRSLFLLIVVSSLLPAHSLLPKELAFQAQTNKYQPQKTLNLQAQLQKEDVSGTSFTMEGYVCKFATTNKVQLENVVFSPRQGNCPRQVMDFANKTLCAKEYETYQTFFNLKKPKKKYMECINNVKDQLIANVNSLMEEQRKNEAKAVASIEKEQFWGADFTVKDYICEYMEKNEVRLENIAFSPNEGSCTLEVMHFLNMTSCEAEYHNFRSLARMGKPIPTRYKECVQTHRNQLVSQIDSWIEKRRKIAAQAERERLAEIARQEQLKKEAEEKRLAEIAKQEQLKKEAEEKRLAEIAKQEQLKKEAEEKIALRKTPNPASDFEYELNQTGDGVLIKSYVGKDSKIFIPAQIDGFPVTELGESSFAGSDVTSVVIPNSVTKIGKRIFYDCEALGQVVLPMNLTKIPAAAFYKCKNLTTIELPPNLEVIGAGAFAGSGLKTIEFPNSLTTIEKGAFINNDLSSIKLPSSLIVIEAGAFADNDLENVVIPNSVTKMGKGVLVGNENIRSLTLSKNIKTLHCPFGSGYYHYDYYHDRFDSHFSLDLSCSYDYHNDRTKTCENLVELKNIEQLKFDQSDETFFGCSKLPLGMQKKLRDLGYKGSF